MRQWAMRASAVSVGSLRTTKIFTASPECSLGYADGRHFAHAGMRGDDFLDFVRIDVEAGDQDHVLLAVDQEDEALLVDIADVAGAQEAVGMEDRGGFFRPLPVALA